jgi:hypothetical protein
MDYDLATGGRSWKTQLEEPSRMDTTLRTSAHLLHGSIGADDKYQRSCLFVAGERLQRAAIGPWMRQNHVRDRFRVQPA